MSEGSSEERVFSVEDANALLPSLRETIERIRGARRVVVARGKRIRDASAMNGGGAQGREYMEAMADLRRDLEALAAIGVILRDPETGLVDFPTRRDGRDVFLCWREGEERVAHWHGMEVGFAGRTPL